VHFAVLKQIFMAEELLLASFDRTNVSLVQRQIMLGAKAHVTPFYITKKFCSFVSIAQTITCLMFTGFFLTTLHLGFHFHIGFFFWNFFPAVYRCPISSVAHFYVT
jgi:hypothetical protein